MKQFSRKASCLSACSTLALTSSIVSLSALAFPSVASAQAAEPDEIIVTARKRDETLQEVPVAISVFNGAMLEENAIASTRDLYANTPGLNYDTGFDQNAATPAIRGVTSNEIATYRQKVTTFLDGMPILGQQGTVPFLAIDQVEVLRGPQSAAFGRSTFGGAINYTTRDPGEALEAEFNIDVGSDNLLDVNGLIAGPILGDQLGGLLALSSRSIDGDDDWVTVEEGEGLGGESSENILAKLLWTPTDSLSVEGRYKRTETDNEQTPRTYLDLDNPNRQIHPDAVGVTTDCNNDTTIANGSACAFVGGFGALSNPIFDYDYASIGIEDPFVRNERERYEVEVNYDFDNDYSIQALAFTSEEYYERATDADLANNTRGFERDPTDIEETYYEARLTSPGDNRFRWGVGVSQYEYDFLTVVYRGLDAYLSGPTGGRQISEDASNVGLFFNTTYDINDNLTGSFEGRYQIDDVGGSLILGTGDTIRQSRETTAFLPRLSLTYTPDNGLRTFYAQYARGNNPSGVNSSVFAEEIQLGYELFPEIYPASLPDIENLAFFDEETVDSFELGVKGRFADSRGTYAINAYKLDWNGYVQAFGVNFQPDTYDAASGNPYIVGQFIDLDDDGVGDVAGTFTGADGNIYTTPAGYDGRYAGTDFNIGRSFHEAGDVEAWGIEFEGSFDLNDYFTIGGAASYIDLEYADNACSTSFSRYGVPDNAFTANGLPCRGIAGNQIGTQPQLSGAVNLSYTNELSDGMEVFARANTRFVTEQYVTEMNLAKLPGYTISDVRVGVSKDDWRAEAYITNLFDDNSPQGPQIFYDGRINNGAGPPTPRSNLAYTARRDRGIGVRLSYKYGN